MFRIWVETSRLLTRVLADWRILLAALFSVGIESLLHVDRSNARGPEYDEPAPAIPASFWPEKWGHHNRRPGEVNLQFRGFSRAGNLA